MMWYPTTQAVPLQCFPQRAGGWSILVLQTAVGPPSLPPVSDTQKRAAGAAPERTFGDVPDGQRRVGFTS